MPPLPPLILASASPRRRELLSRLVPDFTIIPSSAEEIHDASLDPEVLCQCNARLKAQAVARLHPEHLVIGADTLVFLDRAPLGKPRDLEEARRMLAALSGRSHSVITGICLAHAAGGDDRVFATVSQVRFRALSSTDIEAYLALVPVLDKAGAYAVQEQPHRIVESVSGSLSNVIGLPLEDLAAHLFPARSA